MSDGRWIEPKRSWQDTDAANCAVCGGLIPRRSWQFEGSDGATVVACTPDCEELFETYWWPTHGGQST